MLGVTEAKSLKVTEDGGWSNPISGEYTYLGVRTAALEIILLHKTLVRGNIFKARLCILS